MAKGLKTGGRGLGTPNKVTSEVRTAYKELVESNIGNLDNWLNEVAKENPAKAIELVIKLSDFFLPKMKQINHEISDPKDQHIPIINIVAEGKVPEIYEGGKRVN